jgi:hypothetical protein
MRNKIGALICWTCIAGFTACADDEKKTPEPVTPVVTQLAKAVCDLTFRCCNTGEVGYFLGPYLEAADCEARFMNASSFAPAISFNLEPVVGSRTMVPNLEALEQAHREGRGSLVPEAVQKCVEYLSQLACNKPKEKDKLCQAPERSKDTPCDPELLFVGYLQEGQICSSSLASLECAPGFSCGKTCELGVFGRCVRAGKVGDGCFSDVECDRNLYCSQLDGTCQALRKVGETCMFADRDDPSPAAETLLVRCEPGYSCDPVTDTCVEMCERGAACTTDVQCDDEQELTCILNRCDVLRGEGLPCGDDGDCEKLLHCKTDPNDAKSKVCSKGLENDKSCTLHKDCVSGFCKPENSRCAPQLAAGAVCASGENAECKQGSCVPENIICSDDASCPNSKVCDKLNGRCSSYCVELKPDGAQCALASECGSGACVAGYCRTLPLVDGQTCGDDEQCESGFCSLDTERVCKKLPLGLGQPCANATQCDSGVCFSGGISAPKTCSTGLDEGAACGRADQAPCNPKKFFCDTDLTPATCVPLHATGEACDSKLQCRGDCVLRFGRMMCSPVDTTELAACVGADATATSKN